MGGRSYIRWNVREIAGLLRQRQLNKFDANMGVSGARGDGKSTFLFKIFNAFKKDGFKPKKHQVYSQEDVVNLLSNQTFGYCWDDEAINSGYKREFGKSGQINLIKTVTNYRDNFNIYGSALPFFYNLDRALRELIFMHVHIKERGVGVMFLPLEGQIHTQDPWDTVTNKKIEAKENAMIMKNPNHKFRYHLFTTFAGYVFFSPMTRKQEEMYRAIKKEKRARAFEVINDDRPKQFNHKIYSYLLEGKLNKNTLMHLCLIEGKKYSSTLMALNKMLKDNGIMDKTVSDFLAKEKKKANNVTTQIDNLIPDIPL